MVLTQGNVQAIWAAVTLVLAAITILALVVARKRRKEERSFPEENEELT